MRRPLPTPVQVCAVVTAIALAVFARPTLAQPAPELPIKTTVCDLLNEPARYNRQLVQVTGDASHGFEDSGFSSPECNSRYGGLWMSYGGERTTRTKSTANEQDPTRPEPLVVDGIAIPLVEDGVFRRFDTLLHTPANGVHVHATVVARFFAKPPSQPNNPLNGYGHMGCCALFAIQQVLKVFEYPTPGLDPSDVPEQPNTYPFSILDGTRRTPLQCQRDAEAGSQAYAFTDPLRVATEILREAARLDNTDGLHLIARSSSPYRIVYDGKLDGTKKTFMIVVSRPAWLAPYASDPTKVAWIVLAAYQMGETAGRPTIGILK